MAQPGDMLDNPVTRERFIIKTTAAETNGALFVMDVIMQPGGFVIGKEPHVHPQQEERFTIHEGTLTLWIDGREQAATRGDVVVVAAGVPHAARNTSDQVVRFEVAVRPALHIEPTFETYTGLARDGKVNAAGVPSNPLQLAVLALEWPNETIPAQPLAPVAVHVLRLLAAIGRVLGYRAWYPRYAGGKTGRRADHVTS